MKRIKNIMVALDLFPLDERLLAFAKYLGPLLQSKRVIGAHIIPAINIANTFKVEASHLLSPIAPAVGKIEEEVDRLTKKWIASTDINYSSKVVEGFPYQELMNLVEAEHVDLLILGKKEDPYNGRITTKKIARNINCDLFIVPEDSFALVESIVVPMDFSKSSARALERAIYLAEHLGIKKKIECVHVMNLTAKKEESIISDSLDPFQSPVGLVKKMERFKTKFDPENKLLNFSFIKRRAYSIAKSIHEYSRGKEMDLVIMGAHGHNLSERLIFGSVAEEMVEAYCLVPLYIVR